MKGSCNIPVKKISLMTVYAAINKYQKGCYIASRFAMSLLSLAVLAMTIRKIVFPSVAFNLVFLKALFEVIKYILNFKHP